MQVSECVSLLDTNTVSTSSCRTLCCFNPNLQLSRLVWTDTCRLFRSNANAPIFIPSPVRKNESTPVSKITSQPFSNHFSEQDKCTVYYQWRKLLIFYKVLTGVADQVLVFLHDMYDLLLYAQHNIHIRHMQTDYTHAYHNHAFTITYTHAHACTCGVHTYICTYTHTYTHTHTHTHTHTRTCHDIL